MIYLIDDNAGKQRESYGAGFVDEGLFDSCLIHIEQLGKEFEASLTFKDPEAILMHDTLQDFIDGAFVEGTGLAKAKIEDFAKEKKVPIVNFSDGHTGSGEFDVDGNLNGITKSLFYARLYDFLEDYQKNGKPELNILAYGRNFKKILLEREIKNLYVKLSRKSTDERLTLGDIIPAIKGNGKSEPNYLKSIIEMSNPALGMDYEGILDYIEDNELTVGELKQRIDNIFKSVSRYGKNTYTWK